MDDRVIGLGQKIILRTEHGPISFGNILTGSVVSWSSENARDLLISRCWEGLYLYRSEKLSEEELKEEPIKACGPIVGETLGFPVDWNRDGRDDLLMADRWGFLHLVEGKGKYPNISFEYREPIKSAGSGLVFHIPYENPHHPEIDDMGGYVEPQFLNWLYPSVYPFPGNRINLIVGDFSGNLWWFEDVSDENRKPEYKGIEYSKNKGNLRTKVGKDFFEKYGYVYAKPSLKIVDEDGNPFLLGDGYDCGIDFPGGNTRPVLYRNDISHTLDLIVKAGVRKSRFYYLHNVGFDGSRPVFRNLGEIELENFQQYGYGFYSIPIIYEKDGWNHLFISAGTRLGILENKKREDIKPAFKFGGWISANDAICSGVSYNEVLKDKRGRRFLLDTPGGGDGPCFSLKEVKVVSGEVRVDSGERPLRDQHGIFFVEGETDGYIGASWGFHRASLWKYRKGEGQDFIVGTDKGLLYLLIEVCDPHNDKCIRFRSHGPLRDSNGNIIKIHNRACAGGVDLNGDGFEDLIVGGATYQMGKRTDPRPGGGIYYILVSGIDHEGLPRLGTVEPLETRGFGFPRININSHVQIQAVDIDHDGDKEVIIATGEDGYRGRIFKVSRDGIALEYTGKYLELFTGEHKFLDIDDDGRLEIVFAGSEQGIGFYQKMDW